MSVSVLLPVYNAGPALGRAIESILAQDQPDFELIVIEDGSTDGSRALIERYAAQDERIAPVFHEQNIGLAATLNEGLELARNPLVARMDQDDEALPNRLGVQERFMTDRPNVAVAGSWVFHMGRKQRFDRLVRFPTEPAEIRAQLPRENCIYHPSVMFRRDEILALGGYRAEFKNAEDYDLWLRASKVHDLANIPKPLLRYRFSVHGMTHARRWQQLYYVYLAQAMNSGNADDALAVATAEASERLAMTDRDEFSAHVFTGTFNELVDLHMWRDTATVSVRYAREAGVGAATRSIARIAVARARPRAHALRSRVARSS